MPGLSYSNLLIIMAVAVLFLALIFALRQRWRSQPEGLQALLHGRDELHHQLVVPLMVYEERYPSFGKILKLVLSRFPLQSFMRDRDFREAIQHLTDSISRHSAPEKVAASMCAVVRTFVSHPEVEYRCRPELGELLEEFLREVEE